MGGSHPVYSLIFFCITKTGQKNCSPLDQIHSSSAKDKKTTSSVSPLAKSQAQIDRCSLFLDCSLVETQMKIAITFWKLMNAKKGSESPSLKLHLCQFWKVVCDAFGYTSQWQSYRWSFQLSRHLKEARLRMDDKQLCFSFLLNTLSLGQTSQSFQRNKNTNCRFHEKQRKYWW